MKETTKTEKQDELIPAQKALQDILAILQQYQIPPVIAYGVLGIAQSKQIDDLKAYGQKMAEQQMTKQAKLEEQRNRDNLKKTDPPDEGKEPDLEKKEDEPASK